MKIKVVEGKGLFLVDGTLVSADRGDSFIYREGPRGAVLEPDSGSLEVTFPGTPPVVLREGQSAVVAGERAGEVTGTPAPEGFVPIGAEPPPAAVTPAAALPAVEAPKVPPAAAASEQWDPLMALAQAMDKLSRMQKKPKLQLVLELHPYYSFTETYDSNIYMVPKDKANGAVVGGGVVGAWIHEQRAGTTLVLPINRRHKLDASYDLKYMSYSQAPKSNNGLDQSVGGNYEYTGIRGIKARVWDRYVNTEDPAFSELVDRKRRYSNEAGLRVDVERSRRFTYSATVQDTLNKYLDPAMGSRLNRYELAFGGDVGVRIQPKTRLYAAYRREISHYSAGRGDHSKSHRVGLGVDGRLAPKLLGRLQADLYLRKYDNSAAGRSSNVRAITSSVDLQYAVSERAKLSLVGHRSMNESTFSANRYYIATGATLSGSWTFRKLGLGADVGCQADRFPETTTLNTTTGRRRDDLLKFGLRADYRLRPWLSTGLNYLRTQRSSSFGDQFDYTDDRTSVQLKLSF